MTCGCHNATLVTGDELYYFPWGSFSVVSSADLSKDNRQFPSLSEVH